MKESDLDSSIRRLDAVRDSPTCRTPPVPLPPPRSEQDTDDVRVARERYESAKDIVAAIYCEGRHRKWAKAIRQHQLGGEYFNDGTDVSKLAKVIVAISRAAVGVSGDEKSDRDDILGRLLAKLEKIEHFIKTQKLGAEELHTPAICQVFQAAADDGAAAFAAAVEQHGV
ncbi:hypothetical protein CYMTET_16140 [Cymbomonas tetramitiformis]|uniref:Uncharacterized protein n=1 Tax=Cymbomonas tetramitiformis TaxID=36881 RepID=A0AAE0GCL4_9CHLO|nr:hypothetical protein CYMTET_16140 [Cymbomonas tetramitiformis]